MTPFECHKERWKEGCGSTLCPKAHHIVLCRGEVPCDILFVGEAPGPSEDSLGYPFVGPAGHLLDDIIRHSIPPSVKLAFTNLVGCIPLDDDGKKFEEPHKEAILRCSPRLAEIIGIAQPSLVVCCGGLPERWCENLKVGLGLSDTKMVAITHPAAILRAQTMIQKGLMIRRNEIVLKDALNELMGA